MRILLKKCKGINNPNTSKAYKLSLNKFIQYIEINKINDVKQENICTIIHNYKSYLNNKDCKPATINQHLIILKTFINDYTRLNTKI
ncbi:phage integrase SAM-like domain-containing protein [Methanosphaera sp. BMS]|uniref:phage integrase SAM-like domain-containing protein n=1 Tax=Methanosphaera sp. BMS TaxID=1789762 RepID=UPI000DD4C4F4